MRLNLGCSSDLRLGWLNVDIALSLEAEIMLLCAVGEDPVKFPFQQADLSLSWPWEDSSADEIYAADIFEHIGDCDHTATRSCARCDPDPHNRRHWSGRIHVMNESWRVLKPGGILHMECPDAAKGAGQWQDPQHVSQWTPNGLQYFTDGSPAHKRFAAAYGITARFKVLGVTERQYWELVGSVRCEVWKWTGRLEAIK